LLYIVLEDHNAGFQKNCSDQKMPISGTKDKILEVALNLFIAQGFDATPTSQISKEASVSTGTLFYYFPNKNSILE